MEGDGRVRWEERIVLFRPDHVTVVARDGPSRTLTVTETEETGKTVVAFSLPPQTRGLALRLSGERAFPFLREACHADGHLLVEDSGGSWTAHVVECKRTVKPATWKHIQDQLRWSTIRLQLVAEFLGIRIRNWQAWVAFRNDHLRMDTATDAALLRDPSVAEWASGRIGDALSAGSLPVGKILLDATGHAAVNLD